jgi:hypothetical protein
VNREPLLKRRFEASKNDSASKSSPPGEDGRSVRRRCCLTKVKTASSCIPGRSFSLLTVLSEFRKNTEFVRLRHSPGTAIAISLPFGLTARGLPGMAATSAARLQRTASSGASVSIYRKIERQLSRTRHRSHQSAECGGAYAHSICSGNDSSWESKGYDRAQLPAVNR